MIPILVALLETFAIVGAFELHKGESK